MNATNSTSPSISLEINICQYYGELKNPDKANSASLTASFSVVVASILTCPLTIFLNTLILLAFYTKPTLRTKTNVLFMAMAVNDLVKGAIGYPLMLAQEITYQMRHQPNCYLNFIAFNVLAPVSDTLLTAINFERFLGLKFPHWHRVHVTKRRLVVVAVVSFLVGLSSSLLRSFVEQGKFFLMFLFAGCTIATLIFVFLIWRVILRRNQQLHTQQQNQPSTSAISAERKAAKIATYLAMAFLFTRIIPLVMVASVLTEQDWMNLSEREPVIRYLYLLNSFINPLIYGLMNQNMKTGCLELIKCN